MSKLMWGAVLAAAAAVAAVVGSRWRFLDWRPPAHLSNLPVHYEPDLLSKESAAELMALAKDMAVYPTVANDLLFYNATHESIGEARPIGPDGRCDHPLLLPSVNRTLCVLPGRIDVARHYFMTGGYEGLKETLPRLSKRLMSFSRYLFNTSSYPVFNRLFQDASFVRMAKAVCPPNAQVLDPFQTNIIVNAPSQTVAIHTDAPYFWGASRFDVPQWLLAAMVHSGLFVDKFIPQVQIVAYFHQWADAEGKRGGQFVYWDGVQGGTEKRVPPAPRSGSGVDGSQVIHAAVGYRMGDEPPAIDKSARNVLRHQGNDRWTIDSDGKTVSNLTTDDLRFSVVYRARCFASEEERARYADTQLPANRATTAMRLEEDILAPMKAELVRRGRITATDVEALPRLDLALLLIDEFIRYPPPPAAIMPLNYCALATTMPALEPVLQLLC